MAFTSSGSQEIPAETLIRAMLSQVAPTAEVKVDFSPPDVTLPGGTKRVDYSMLLQGSVLMKGMGYVTKTDKYSLFVWSLGQENLETEEQMDSPPYSDLEPSWCLAATLPGFLAPRPSRANTSFLGFSSD